VRSVGVRELREKTSEIVRDVREKGEVVNVTYRGKTVARIVPTDPPRPDPEAVAAWWERWKALGAEISKYWPEGVSAVDAIREQRREL
jgi:prevent-host-death family protein